MKALCVHSGSYKELDETMRWELQPYDPATSIQSSFPLNNPLSVCMNQANRNASFYCALVWQIDLKMSDLKKSTRSRKKYFSMSDVCISNIVYVKFHPNTLYVYRPISLISRTACNCDTTQCSATIHKNKATRIIKNNGKTSMLVI